MASSSELNLRSFSKLAFGGGTPRKAAITALFVGSILVAINHGDSILAGHPLEFHKVILTYCVPYCVATWGAMTGKMSVSKSDNSL
jgi:hypothetical protein